MQNINDWWKKEGFSDKQIEQIEKGLEDNLEVEQVSSYAKKELSSEEVEQIRKRLKEGK